MHWFRIPKESSTKPESGKYYTDWKEHLSIEARQQCVYCCIHINSFGGIRNFHVEHYKPKANDKFPELKHDYNNLFFACSICNGFKGDDWPAEPSKRLNNPSYPDPSIVDYADFLFQNNLQFIESNCVAGRYIIQKLFLNRPQLVLERKYYFLQQRLKKEIEELKTYLLAAQELDKKNPLLEAFISTIETTILLIEGNYINPYEQAQIKR